MSRPDSFSRQVKNELCRVTTGNSCCHLTELAVAIVSVGRFHGTSVTITTAHAQYAERLTGLMHDRYSIEPKIRHGSELQTITLGGASVYERLMIDLRKQIGFDIVNDSMNPVSIKSDCCLRAALRGFFLSGGSIAEPQNAYHLELSIHRSSAALLAISLLSRINIRSGILTRNGYSVVYLKEGQNISDFLLQTGAHESLLAFESLRVDKEMRNSVNRVVNCDNANSQRIANTSARQLELLRELERTMGFGTLPAELQAAALARLDNPDFSLRELGELMEPPIGKSGMNHRLKKLENIAAGRVPNLSQSDGVSHEEGDPQ
jgi:DNA-binding protein WhiA